MKFAAWAVTFALLLLGGAVAFAILRGEDTRDQVRTIRKTVDPCAKPRSVECQRRVRLVLKQLERRGKLRELGLTKRTESSVRPGGGGATGSPQTGGGPVGRVPPREDSPPAEQPDPPQPERRPAIDLRAPVVPLETCVGDLLGVNC